MEFLKGKQHFLKTRTSSNVILCLMLVVLQMGMEPAFLNAASARTIGEEQLPNLHAALVLKITMFVKWRENPPVCEEGQFSLAIAGDDMVFEAFNKLSDKKIKKCGLNFIHNSSPENIQTGRILFISSRFTEEFGSLNLREKFSPGVLTISDESGFCAQGGMIKISIKNGRPHFTINVRAATAAGIRFSSKLLKIATIYKEETS